MRVGFHSPLPPARTGVADYAAALLAGLRRHGEVDVAPAQAEIHLYQLGNNPLHSGAHAAALARPGVVTLHDATLQHFYLGRLSEAEYVEEFVYNYGEWNRALAAELWRGRAASGSDARYFAYPMLRRIVERSRAVVAHNPEAVRIALQHAPAARVVEIPHLFEPPVEPDVAEVARFRQRLGVESNAFLFAIFGYLRETKRVLQVISAFAALHAENPRTALLLAGQFVSRGLERAALPLLSQPGLLRLPHLSEPEFWLAAHAADAAVNLRFPSAGETSGIAIRLMGIGKPVLVTASAEYARIPLEACLRVEAGAAERESLLAHMRLLPSVPEAARHIGRRAAETIGAGHSIANVAGQYWELLCDCCG